jgi:hypothetical protein
MNVQETTDTTTELDIRELTATELDHVSGGFWVVSFIISCYLLALMDQACAVCD